MTKNYSSVSITNVIKLNNIPQKKEKTLKKTTGWFRKRTPSSGFNHYSYQ